MIMDPTQLHFRHHLSADRRSIACQLARALDARDEISFAYLHGSFAEGLPHRDIDIAVYLLHAGNAVDAFEYATDLAITLTRLVGQVVDVQVLNAAPLALQHAVLQGDAILVRDDVALADYIEHVAMEYMDFAELGRQHLREVLGR
jgi:uncharacterized protein